MRCDFGDRKRNFLYNRDPVLKSLPHFFAPPQHTLKIGRVDKSALVKKAVSVTKRGEFRDYSEAANHYGYDRSVKKSLGQRNCVTYAF